jgi:hypothetical protein
MELSLVQKMLENLGVTLLHPALPPNVILKRGLASTEKDLAALTSGVGKGAAMISTVVTGAGLLLTAETARGHDGHMRYRRDGYTIPDLGCGGACSCWPSLTSSPLNGIFDTRFDTLITIPWV